MRVIRHLAPLALGAVLLAGCGSSDAATDEATTAASATPTTESVEVPSAEASATPEVEATAEESADATPTAAPSASPTEQAAPDAAATPTEGTDLEQSTPDQSTPVSGPVSIVDYAVHLPGGPLDACLSGEGSMTCFFETPRFAECGGEEPLGFVTFVGGAVETGCRGLGEVGAVPQANVGQTFGDPDGNFVCETLDDPALGLRCTEQASGKTALLTADKPGVVG